MKWLAMVLTAIFIGAKLAHFINWSWWLVLAPAWIYAGLIFFFFAIIGVIAIIAVAMDEDK